MPSIALTRLEALLSEPEFWEGELFFETEEAARDLTPDDWAILHREARGRQDRWWEYLLGSLSEVTDRSAVTMALDLLSDPDPSAVKHGLEMLDALAAGAGAHLGDRELRILATAWQTHPEHRDAIRMAAWRKGQPGRLRTLLGLERWTDRR